MAVEAAKLQMRAASASLKAVEEGIALHAQNRDYGKLKEIAEASGLAAKVAHSPLRVIVSGFGVQSSVLRVCLAIA